MLNYLYCDVVGLMDPKLLKIIMSGTLESGIQLTPGFLLGASIMMEIPIAMVILSRLLKYGINRWANIFAGALMTVVQISSLFAGTPTAYYIFFSVIEISCTALIVYFAWTWPKQEA